MKKLAITMALLAGLLAATFSVLHFSSTPAQAQNSGAFTTFTPVSKPLAFTFTANGTKTLTFNGYGPVVIVTSGTFTGMTFNVTGSNDNTNFIALPIVAGFIGGPAPGAAATQPVTAANPAAWSTNIQGLTQVKVQNICTACTGTVSFQVTAQGR